jgi:V/A-type H+/Na+-transporting ATPase subunit I
MALDAVSKIEVLCHSARREAVLGALESFGRVHLVDLPQTAGIPEGLFSPVAIDADDLVQRIGNLENAIDFLRKQSLGQEPGEESRKTPHIRERDLHELLEDSGLIHIARRSWLMAMRMTRLEGDEKELIQEIAFLEPWRPIPVPLEMLRHTGSFRLLAGVLAKGAVEGVRLLAREHPLMHVEVLESDRDSQRVLIALHESEARDLVPALVERGFVQQEFGARSGTAAALVRDLNGELDQIRRRKSALHDLAVEYAGSLNRLMILRDAAGLLLMRLRIAGTTMETSHVSMLRAWIRKADLPGLRTALAGIGEVSIDEIRPDEGEIPPSPLTEKNALQPYTLLTEMYGSPTRRDPDPTPLIAPFFALFFGICLGDAGYGLTLALGAGLGWAIVKRRHGKPRLFPMLFQGGLAAIPIGVFLGAWFGMDYASLPGFLQAPADLLNRLVPGFIPGEAGQEGFSVSKQFLYLALGLGIVQILVGVVVSLVKRLRDGQGLVAVADQTGWFLATIGLFPWLFNHYLLNGSLYDLNGPLERVFTTMLATGAVLIFIIGGREAKGFGRIGLGAYAAYGIVNLLGDVLSYSRLFALSLSGGIIAQVVNQIAGMLRSQIGIPAVGILLSVIVLAAGHLFNLAMGCLSGFIHTTRLQFVEFFTKFYEGTGVPFRPLRYQPRFIHIDRDQ